MDTELNITREEFGATMMRVGFTADQFELVYSYTDRLEAEIKHLTGLSEGYVCVIKQKEAEIKAKDERIAELEAKLENMCATCECAKFADNAIKPSEMWKLHTILKDNK